MEHSSNKAIKEREEIQFTIKQRTEEKHKFGSKIKRRKRNRFLEYWKLATNFCEKKTKNLQSKVYQLRTRNNKTIAKTP